MSKSNLKSRGLVCGFFMGASLMFGCSNETPPILMPLEQNHIAGVYIGMLEGELKDHLGQESKRDDTTVEETSVLSYSGLDVSLMAVGFHLESPKVVTGIGTTSPLHCFRDDVCPGDELKEIQKKLGTFENKIEAADATHQLLYRLTSDGCMLSIGTQDSRTVRDIDIYCLR